MLFTRRTQTWSSWLVLALIAATLAACAPPAPSPDPPEPPAPTLESIAVTPAASDLEAGGTLQLTATGSYSDGSTRDLTDTAAWSSEDEALATVESGLVSALSAGEVTITATVEGSSGSAALTIGAPAPEPAPEEPPDAEPPGEDPAPGDPPDAPEPPADPGLITTLTVAEDSGIERISEPVTAGVPLARSLAVTHVDRLALMLDGVEIPAQLTVLSRWGGPIGDTSKPIRWVLIDCQLSLKAGTKVTLSLTDLGTRATPRPAHASPLTVDAGSDPDAVSITTGAFSVAIDRKTGGLLRSVALGGTEVVGADGGLTVVSGGTTYRSALAAPSVVSVETSGPLRTVVKVVSDLTSAGGAKLLGGKVRMVTRITAFAGRSELRLDATLENSGSYGGFTGSPDTADWLRFSEAQLAFPLTLGASRSFSTAGVDLTGTAASSWRVMQTHAVVAETDESRNFSYAVTAGGSSVGSGARHPGWIAVGDGTTSVTAGIRWFWQTYHKALSLRDSSLVYELWPADGGFPSGSGYTLQGGRHSRVTCRLRLDSGPVEAGRSSVGHTAAVKPLLMRAPGRYYAASGGFNVMDSGALVYSGTADDARMNRAYARYNTMRKIMAGAAPADADAETDVVSLVDAREARYEALGTTADWYGWAHFGDNAWGGGYASGHYDMGGFMMLHHLRLGDRALWDRGEEQAVFMSTYGQYHHFDANPYAPAVSFYEKTDHGGDADGDFTPPIPSHNWLRRLVYYHWLTGDMRAKEAALTNATGIHRYFAEAMDVFTPGGLDSFVLTEARFSGWSLDNALAVYQLTGEKKWIDLARALYENGLRYLYDSSGHLEDAGPREKGWVLFTAYTIEPIIRLYFQTEDAALKANILDLVRGVITGTLEKEVVPHEGSGAAYKPTCITDEWDGSSPGPESNSMLYNLFCASAYALIGWVDKKPAYLERAHRLFADGVLFHDYYASFPEHPTVDESAASPYTWASGVYPGSESKVHARFNRAGLPYLFIVAKVIKGE